MCNLRIKHGGIYVILIVLMRLVSNVNAGDGEFIREYFLHKTVRSVVGFSCGDITSRCNHIEFYLRECSLKRSL